MAWIKRNLLFVVGGGVALILVGVATFYFISNLSKDKTVTEELNAQISELQRIYNAPVHPGTETVDNISAAKKDQQRIRAFLQEARKEFVPVPSYKNTDDKGFNTLLGTTIYELQTSASNSGVTLPPLYAFSFAAQQEKLSFATNSIEPWIGQLSEIKALCNILFSARINSLEGIRRVPVSIDDPTGTADYLSVLIVTNDISLVSPYEVAFRSFSAELGAVVNGILSSTNCFIIKTLMVEPSKTPPGGGAAGGGFGGASPYSSPNTGFGVDSRYAPVNRGFNPGASARPVVPGVPQIFQSEKPLHVTMLIDVVKLKPAR